MSSTSRSGRGYSLSLYISTTDMTLWIACLSGRLGWSWSTTLWNWRLITSRTTATAADSSTTGRLALCDDSENCQENEKQKYPYNEAWIATAAESSIPWGILVNYRKRSLCLYVGSSTLSNVPVYRRRLGRDRLRIDRLRLEGSRSTGIGWSRGRFIDSARTVGRIAGTAISSSATACTSSNVSARGSTSSRAGASTNACSTLILMCFNFVWP